MRPPDRPLVSLLTDFGDRDPWAAICRGVILSIAPDARLLDISHVVTKFSVREGAYLLWCALPYLPVGVHVGVVDPGVGTERRPVALQVGRGDVLVGPDNGLLVPAAERLGGIVAAHRLDEPRYHLPVVSASFHGRDIFAPVGAHLANGVPLGSVGSSIDPAGLVPLAWAAPVVEAGHIAASVVFVDTFGNVKLGADRADVIRAFGSEPGGEVEVHLPALPPVNLPWRRTFGEVDPGQPVVYLDAFDRLCLAVNQGSAARRFGLVEDAPVALRLPGATSR